MSDSPSYLRRRLVVGLSAVGLVAVGVVAAIAVGGGGDGDVIEIARNPATTTTTTTTPPSTTRPSTTTTTTTTTSTTTTTTTTTTTVAPSTTVLNEVGVPVWPPYEPLPALDGIAALTGEPADATVTARPILAVKIDNYRRGRPQWGLDQADAVIEENVEGVTRFVALFHSRLPDRAGPVRSARTGDLDLLAAMNRPVLGWSGGNPGVTAWVGSAASSGLLVDFTAQRNPCYQRNSSRSAPHNLLLDPACALGSVSTAGPARPLWSTDATWVAPPEVAATPDATFDVGMDGVRVAWTWDATSGRYLRSQDGQAHVAVSGERIAADNVVLLASFHAPSPVDARSPNPITVGSGAAVVHRDGVAIAATWSRAEPYDPFVFLDVATGQPIPLDTGVTFVELVRDR